MKPKKKGSKIQPKKVFDVMRPGKTAASATSRPVIVGHKPQIKDPMMSDRQDEEHLLDSKQKVALEPAEGAAVPQPPATNVATTPVAAEPTAIAGPETPAAPETVTPHPAPETVATVAFADTVAPPTPDDPVAPAPSAQPETVSAQSAEQIAPPAQSEPTPAPGMSSQPATQVVHAAHPSAPGNTGVIFEEMPPEPATANKQPAASTEPLPSLPEEQQPMQQAQVFVSHHTGRKGSPKKWVLLALLLVIIVVVVDVLLDLGIISAAGVPHTNFL